MRTRQTALVGNLPTYNFTYGDFNSYIDRLEQYFLMNKIANEEKQKAILLITVEEESYKIIRDLVFPILPKNKTYQELIDVIRQKVGQQSSVWQCRLVFNNAKQEENETIAEWIERVRKLSAECKFSYELDLYLINRFITGIRNKDIQERLFEENHELLTLDRAIEIATNKEINLNEITKA